MQRQLSDWGGNLVAFAAMIVVNVLANALPINDQTQAEISAKYPSLFTPAGFAFSIWGLIYLSLLVFVTWQALPAQRGNERLAGISRLFQVNCAANAAWMIVWHYDLLLLSLAIMLLILVTLVMIYRALLVDIAQSTWLEHVLLHLPFSLYTGWITLATIANASVLQNAYGWDDVGLDVVSWTLLKIALAGAVGATMIVRFRDPVFALVVAWAAYGISVRQAATPAVSGAAAALAMLAVMLVLYEFVRRLQRS